MPLERSPKWATAPWEPPLGPSKAAGRRRGAGNEVSRRSKAREKSRPRGRPGGRPAVPPAPQRKAGVSASRGYRRPNAKRRAEARKSRFVFGFLDDHVADVVLAEILGILDEVDRKSVV